MHTTDSVRKKKQQMSEEQLSKTNSDSLNMILQFPKRYQLLPTAI